MRLCAILMVELMKTQLNYGFILSIPQMAYLLS